MNIIHEYVRAHLKANKRSSLFIFTAIMIAATLLCAVGVLTYSQWLNEIDMTVRDRGDWHARLEAPVAAEQLKYIQLHPQVDKIYLESQRQSLQLTGTERPYLSLMQLNADAWENTPRKRTLLEGRLPEQRNEIIVSKLFFAENPQYKIGDTLLLPKGQRILDGKQLAEHAPRLKGETFQATGEETFIITGSINESSVSAYPCYYAYGFADLQTSLPQELFTVSVHLSSISDTYEVAPQLAERSGLKPAASGEYAINYNKSLLTLYGVKAPYGQGGSPQLSSYALSAILTMGLVMLLFIVLIYNAFAVTTASQVRQLGILKSVGATPKQIRRAVLYEAMVPACIAIPLGLLLGYAGMAGLIQVMEAMLKDNLDTQLRVVFSWPIILVAGTMSLVTVLLSAWVPAKNLAKLLPIEAIRNSPAAVKDRKTRERRWIHKWFAIEGELAFNAFAANKKAYRTILISLTLFITVFIGFQSFAVIWKTDQKLTLAQKKYTLDLSIATVEEPDPAMLTQLSALPGIQKQVVYRGRGAMGGTMHSFRWDKQKISPDFAAVGGFEDDYYQGSGLPTNLAEEKGQPRISLELKGLDGASFADYCRQIGVDAGQFADHAQSKAIIVNRTTGNIQSFIDQYNIPETDYLDLAVGDTLSIDEEYSLDQPLSSGQYSLTVGALTDQYPQLDENYYPYDLVIVLPMDAYENIVQKLNAERALEYRSISYKIHIPREQLAAAQQQANAILKQYLPPEDWSTFSLLDKEQSNSRAIRSIELLVGGFAILFGCIGITGAFSTVAGNLSARRREFAILRSTGLSPQGMNRMLRLESLFFGFSPLLLSLPLLVCVCGVMLQNALYASWADFIANAPWNYILLCCVLVVGSVWLAYRITGARIKKESIIETIKDEKL